MQQAPAPFQVRLPSAPPAVAPQPVVHPVAVTVQMPPERHDYTSDTITGVVGLGGALIGALLGAYAAYKFGQKAAREARREDRLERDKDLAQSLVQSLSSIYSAQKSSFQSIAAARVRLDQREAHNRMAAAVADLRGQPVQMRLHINQEVRPLANLPARSAVTPEQVNVGERVGGGAILNTLMMIGDRHNGTVDLWSLYGTRKALFEQMAAQWVKYDGQYVAYTWTPEEYDKLRPALDEMDRLVAIIEEQSKADMNGSFEALTMLIQGMVNRGWAKDGAKIKSPGGADVEITTAASKEERQSGLKWAGALRQRLQKGGAAK